MIDGALRLRCTSASFPRTLDPPDFLRQALALADRLSGERAEERLAAIVRSDPETAVRARALELLRDERPDHPSTHDAFLAGCDDAGSVRPVDRRPRRWDRAKATRRSWRWPRPRPSPTRCPPARSRRCARP